MIRLEICVDTLAGLTAAVRGGADRIELCSALALGGLSPSLALLQAAMDCPVPVFVMVRPRAGGFRYSDGELAGMEQEIRHIRDMRFAGVVFGAGSEAGLDVPALQRLAGAASGLGKTLHRVVDLLPDRRPILALVRGLGFERMLTSGGRPTAVEALDELRDLVAMAPAGLSIMPGSGVRPETLPTILARTGAQEIHASAGVALPDGDGKEVALGFRLRTVAGPTPESVRALKELCRGPVPTATPGSAES